MKSKAKQDEVPIEGKDECPALPPEEKNKNHNSRTVSWEMDNTKPPAEVVKPTMGDSSVISRTSYSEDPHLLEDSSPLLGSVSLNDVIGAAPMESEAETYLQRTLEEDDPTKAGKSKAQKAILSQVPDCAKHTFEEVTAPKEEEEDEVAGQAEYRPTEKTSAEKLSCLAADLSNMHGKGSKWTSPISQSMSSTDTFVRNATNLFAGPRRRRASKKTDEAVSDEQDADIETGRVDDHDERKTIGIRQAKESFYSNYRDMEDMVKFRKDSIRRYIRTILLFSILPATFVSALLFYAFDNPPCGTSGDCLKMGGSKIEQALNITAGSDELEPAASVSWWLLFIFVRQLIMLSLAKVIQAFIIDWLCLRSRRAVQFFGPWITLLVVQSKGWPFILVCWAIVDFLLLYGNRSFAKHCEWQ